MSLKHYDFEAGTDGATATTAATGATTLTTNGGTASFDSTAAANGSLGLKLVSAGAADNTARFAANAASNTMSFAASFIIDAVPASNITLFNLRYASGPAFRAFVATSGHLQVDGATVSTQVDTGVNLVPGTQYRIEVQATVGTTTTNGVVSVSVFLGNSATPITTAFTSSSFNLGTSPISAVDIVTTANRTLKIDDVRFNDGTTTPLGPVPVTTVTVQPNAVFDNTGAFTNQGGAASLQAAVADALDTTYVESPTAPANKTVTFSLPNLASGSVKVTARMRMQPTAGPTTTGTIELLQGTTVIAASSALTVTDTFADYVLALSSAQNTAITDRTNLRVRVTANQP